MDRISREIKSLQDEHRCWETLDQVKTRIATMGDEEAALQKRLERETERESALQQRLSALEDTCQDLESKSNELRAESENLNSEIEYAELKLEKTRSDTLESLRRCRVTESRMSEIQASVDDMSRKHQRLKDAVQTELQRNTELQQRRTREEWVDRRSRHVLMHETDEGICTDQSNGHESSLDTMFVTVGVLQETMQEALARIIRIFMLSNMDEESNVKVLEDACMSHSAC